MPFLSLLVKPCSGGCNMRCRYCFYHDEGKNRETFSYGSMSEKTLETVIQKALQYADQYCSFGFQGGEPTLRGLDFFRRVVELQKKYNVHGIQIANSIQTNGLLIDREWAGFLHDNHFLVGLSIDGTEEIHNENRVDSDDRGTYDRVLRTAHLLEAHQVDFNVLTVVTGRAADSVTEIYQFFRRYNLLYQQYIPCLEPLGEEHGSYSYSLTPEKYSVFLKTLFDLWYRDVTAGRFIYIRYFENLVGMLMGYPPESCNLIGHCTIQNVVESDGSVFPCDFYCLDQWKLGTVQDDDFGVMMKKAEAVRFLEESVTGMEECRKCPYYYICRSGCRRDREPIVIGRQQTNYYCSSYKEFFAYALPRLRKMAEMISKSEQRRRDIH
ncbi:anaerobic sulfatase maturase [Parablautia intestinalis]|uniref:Anaerobic sulfatase maturase n=1 Tax=Parablautia intestinalis TaxID=2320100 RepID=A0A3A9A6Z7_9FIRM|nr:anaerobic sulfatase maturase [Parablautia intestinalis]RKI87530.1 anaerobic sulfatase maturase [Parablautia intestinalis]